MAGRVTSWSCSFLSTTTFQGFVDFASPSPQLRLSAWHARREVGVKQGARSSRSSEDMHKHVVVGSRWNSLVSSSFSVGSPQLS